MNQSNTREEGFSKGLENVVAGNSEICLIDGGTGKLIYRGYDINELVEKTSFEEVLYLLWNGELPNEPQLDELKKQMDSYQTLPGEVIDVIRLIANRGTPMDVLRTAVSLLKSFDPDGEDAAPEANYRRAVRLAAVFPIIVAGIGRLRQNLDIIAPRKGLGIAANFLYMLRGEEADPFEISVMDAGLILHADHEFNASTFACRVTCATLSDMYSAVVSGIGTLKGPLHGGANAAVMKLLLEMGEINRVEEVVKHKLARKEKISGFGHRVYKTMDPRAEQLRALSHQLAERTGNTKWIEMTEKLFETVHHSKGMWPNVDLFSASVYHSMGINVDLYTAIFAVSRIAGWTAHILEQYANNRLIRPTSHYKGRSLRPVLASNER